MKHKRALAFALSVIMTAGALQLQFFATVLAASVVGTLNGKEYTSFKKLVGDLADDYGGKSVTIEMKNNWNAADDGDFDRVLEIPKNCKATLYMHGKVYNRNRAFRGKSTGDGELIIMRPGSSINIIGSSGEAERQTRHDNVATFSSTYKDGRKY
ncbi:MAG: hypothetical protein IKH76_11560 [Clostridiales bacterium]|nr:hypothetical protein [Clostridiales bacterium]